MIVVTSDTILCNSALQLQQSDDVTQKIAHITVANALMKIQVSSPRNVIFPQRGYGGKDLWMEEFEKKRGKGKQIMQNSNNFNMATATAHVQLKHFDHQHIWG